MKNKYSLVDQFVKQYTSAPVEKPAEKPAEKSHEHKKEHKKKHHHHHKHHKGHKHHKEEKDSKKPEEKDKKPEDKKSFVQLKDFDDDEDKEILESIKYAENKLGSKMGTPQALPKEHQFAPVKYDVEDSGPLKKDKSDAYLNELTGSTPGDKQNI